MEEVFEIGFFNHSRGYFHLAESARTFQKSSSLLGSLNHSEGASYVYQMAWMVVRERENKTKNQLQLSKTS